jgi:uncharacterized protein with HEPN domain
MPPEIKKLLSDALEACRTVDEFVAGKSVADFLRDKLLRAGVYYEFAIIGEALTQLRSLDATVFTRISECTRIIGFRNQIIHGYGKLDDEITWRIIETKLPVLRKELETLLAS